MRRFAVAVLTVTALVTGLAVLPAAAVSGVKPPKLDPPTMDGGQPYPLGLGGKYGVIQLSWPTPTTAGLNLTGYTVTCTPKYFKPPAVNTLTTTPIVVTVSLTPSVTVTNTGGDPSLNSDYSNSAGVTKLKVRELQAGADTVYPPRVCNIAATNALGSKAG
jgi:hypothetical protein